MKKVLFLAGLAAVLAAGAAEAHPKLTGVWPSADATVSAPDVIRLKFSERLIPRLSHVDLTAADGKPIKTANPSVATDGKQLSLKPAARLKPGTYTIGWTAVSVDTHRVQGKSRFTVK